MEMMPAKNNIIAMISTRLVLISLGLNIKVFLGVFTITQF